MNDELDKIEEERKKRDLEVRIRIIETIVNIVNRGVNRQKRYEDPVLRATLLLDKLVTIVDIGIATFTGFNSDLPEPITNKVKDASQILTEELNFLMDWVTSPIYSPDHPYGNKLMKKTEEKFNEKIDSNV